jgi:phosphate transport system permease protein
VGGVGATCLVVTGALFLLIVGFLLLESKQAWDYLPVSRYFTDEFYQPDQDGYYMWPTFLGSILTSLGALILSTPLALAAALLIRFYAPASLGGILEKMLELMAGIPSVVWGFWGLVSIVPVIARYHEPGPSFLAGVIVLTAMVLPTSALVMNLTFRRVSREHLRVGAAMGIPLWGMISKVLLPSARSGILCAMALGVSRALGESVAVLMVCGNVVRIPESIFDPVRTLPVSMLFETSYAFDLHRSSLFRCCLLLLGVSACVVLLIRRFERKMKLASSEVI